MTYHTKPFHIRRISPLNLYVDHKSLAVRFPYSLPLPFEYSLVVRSFPLFVGNLLGNRLQYHFVRLLCYLFYFPGSPLSFPLPPQNFFVNKNSPFTFLSSTTSTVLCPDLYDTIFLSFNSAGSLILSDLKSFPPFYQYIRFENNTSTVNTTDIIMYALSKAVVFATLLATAPSSLVEASPVASPQATTAASPATGAAGTSSSYWLANIQRQGKVPFGNSSSYTIFRNVMDFGAKGKFRLLSVS